MGHSLPKIALSFFTSSAQHEDYDTISWLQREQDHYWEQGIVGHVVQKSRISMDLMLLKTVSSSCQERKRILGKQIIRTVQGVACSFGTRGPVAAGAKWAGVTAWMAWRAFPWVSLIPGGRSSATCLSFPEWLSGATLNYAHVTPLNPWVLRWPVGLFNWLQIFQEPVPGHPISTNLGISRIGERGKVQP